MRRLGRSPFQLVGQAMLHRARAHHPYACPLLQVQKVTSIAESAFQVRRGCRIEHQCPCRGSLAH
jgi:hypothetical protein